MAARDYTFDGTLLDGAGGAVDISLFEQGGQLPGTYFVDVLVNGERVDRREVVFSLTENAEGKPTLAPCLSMARLSQYGVKVESFNDSDVDAVDTLARCADLHQISQVTADFDFNQQTLNLQVPQVALRPQLKGIAPEDLWNDGITALLLNWQANTSQTVDKGGTTSQKQQDATYIQLQPGINLGAWRVRNATTWQRASGNRGQWQSVYTYAERGLNQLKSRVTLGERSTPGDIFDSVPFRGVMVGSDESMVPSGVSSYAPLVRGTARSQARVEVTQDGYTLYSGMVSAGPFALSDLTPTGSGGDLHVTVYEADGSRQTFTVPYQIPAIALREGYLKFNAMAGQYRPANRAVDKSIVYQGTVMYGLPWNLTAYTGGQLATHYRAATAGVGVSLGSFGALSFDATQSHGDKVGSDTERGHTWRARYSKQMMSTNTTFTLASYQYSSKGYHTLSDVLDSWQGSSSESRGWNSNDRRRTRTSLTVNQALGDWGYLTLSGSRENYWNRPGHNDNWSAGYGRSLDGVTVSVNYTENKNIDSAGITRSDRIMSLWLSVPLDRWTGSPMNAVYQYTTPSGSSDTHEVSLNGRAFDRQLYWDVSQRYRPQAVNQDRNSMATRLSWTGTYGQVGGSYSQGQARRQMSFDASGGMIAHSQGVTFGQSLGETVALVEAPGASGVSVGGWPGVKTDGRGYTTLSYLSPYQENRVSLDPVGLSDDAEVTQTDTHIVPTQGAVMPAKFATRVGGRALMTILRADGSPVPYGALAVLEADNVGAGVVGERGQVYLTGLPEQGQLIVKWAQGQCQVRYTLPANKDAMGMYTMRQTCR
ncbi:TPA: fimbria/pilus outer membrane usher protein [Providencia alcalifaciens]